MFRAPGNRELVLGFALKELLVIAAVSALSLYVIVAELTRARHRSKAICCNCNLKQIGLSFPTWELDHMNLFPMGLSTNFGGALEDLTAGRMFRLFQVMSNELSTPQVLTCPADSRRPAQNFGPGFVSSNLSYFVGIPSNSDNPQMFLSGDSFFPQSAPQPTQFQFVGALGQTCPTATIFRARNLFRVTVRNGRCRAAFSHPELVGEVKRT